MTCAEVGELKDAFLDGELSGPMLLDVARHTGSCAACDGDLRTLAALQQVVGRTLREEAAGLDLSGLWAKVDARLDTQAARERWRRRWRTLPAWGVGFAAAASVAFWMQPERPAEVASNRMQVARPAVRRVAVRQRDHAFIDSLRGKNVTAHRDPKAGTIIWVNYPAGGVGQ